MPKWSSSRKCRPRMGLEPWTKTVFWYCKYGSGGSRLLCLRASEASRWFEEIRTSPVFCYSFGSSSGVPACTSISARQRPSGPELGKGAPLLEASHAAEKTPPAGLLVFVRGPLPPHCWGQLYNYMHAFKRAIYNLAASDSLPITFSMELWFLKCRRDGPSVENKSKLFVIVSNERWSCVEVCSGIFASPWLARQMLPGRDSTTPVILDCRYSQGLLGGKGCSRPRSSVRLLLIDRQGQQRAQSFSHQTVSPWRLKVEYNLLYRKVGNVSGV